jgi:hypothetical protein
MKQFSGDTWIQLLLQAAIRALWWSLPRAPDLQLPKMEQISENCTLDFHSVQQKQIDSKLYEIQLKYPPQIFLEY